MIYALKSSFRGIKGYLGYDHIEIQCSQPFVNRNWPNVLKTAEIPIRKLKIHTHLWLL